MGQNIETAILHQDSVPVRLDLLAKIVLVVLLVLLVITVKVVLQAMIIMAILIAENLDTKVSSMHLCLCRFRGSIRVGATGAIAPVNFEKTPIAPVDFP